MNELDIILRKNRLDVMIIKASAEVEKTNNYSIEFQSALYQTTK